MILWGAIIVASPPPSPAPLQGLTADGFLLAMDSEGRTYELSPDGNR